MNFDGPFFSVSVLRFIIKYLAWSVLVKIIWIKLGQVVRINCITIGLYRSGYLGKFFISTIWGINFNQEPSLHFNYWRAAVVEQSLYVHTTGFCKSRSKTESISLEFDSLIGNTIKLKCSSKRANHSKSTRTPQQQDKITRVL